MRVSRVVVSCRSAARSPSDHHLDLAFHKCQSHMKDAAVAKSHGHRLLIAPISLTNRRTFAQTENVPDLLHIWRGVVANSLGPSGREVVVLSIIIFCHCPMKRGRSMCSKICDVERDELRRDVIIIWIDDIDHVHLMNNAFEG